MSGRRVTYTSLATNCSRTGVETFLHNKVEVFLNESWDNCVVSPTALRDGPATSVTAP